MKETADILIFGTGSFAARIIFDIAATASETRHRGGSRATACPACMAQDGGHARAAIFEHPVRISTESWTLLAPMPPPR
jgi:hypothetical protein